MTSPTRINEAKRRRKKTRAGAKRKKATNVKGSTLSAAKLFAVKKG